VTPEEAEARRTELGALARERELTLEEWEELAELYGMPVPEWVRGHYGEVGS
jgi:hypothetical protein